jgi:simple sugar transport system permease protein
MKNIRSFIENVGLPRVIIGVLLLVLFILAPFVQVRVDTSLSDIIKRFGMTSILVLAMVPMVQSGCGLNFGIQIGIIAGFLAQRLR